MRRFVSSSPRYRVPLDWLIGAVTCMAIFGWLAPVTAGLLCTPVVRLLRGEQAAHRYATAVAQTWMSLVLWFTKAFGMQIEFRGDTIEPWENAIVLSNHQSMADPPLLLAVGRRVGRMSRMTYIVKDAIRYVPLLGLSIKMLGYIFVKRDWMKDYVSIQNAFSRVTSAKLPIWLLIFPEGTRITGQKLRQSQEYARTHHMHVPVHTLLPKPKGFVSAVAGLRGQLDGVVDVTLIYPDGIPTLWQLLQGLVPRIIFDVRCTPISGLPEDPEGLTRWLQQRYAQKDIELQLMND